MTGPAGRYYPALREQLQGIAAGMDPRDYSSAELETLALAIEGGPLVEQKPLQVAALHRMAGIATVDTVTLTVESQEELSA